MKISRSIFALKYFLKTPKIWERPKQARVLIYDLCGAEVFYQYINEDLCEILAVRGEHINLYALFQTLISRKLTLSSYVSHYIKCVKPKVILTFIDNNPGFYEIKKNNPDVITVFIQNGVRTDDAFIKNGSSEDGCDRSYFVDYMLVFGSAIASKYSTLIRGKTISIGSFKNNLVPIKNVKSKRNITFISQYGPPSLTPLLPYAVDKHGKEISYESFYSIDILFVQFLKRYCGTNGYDLEICGTKALFAREESDYFTKVLGLEGWRFFPRETPYGSYERIDASSFVVCVDSTMGYEALARGKKTGFISARGQAMGCSDRGFGWPAGFPDNGPFWTNEANKAQFTRVMDYITSVSDQEWEQVRKKFMPEVMEFDHENTKFRKLMSELNVPLRPEFESPCECFQ